MDNFIGEIRLVGFNYAPDGWFSCDGSILQIMEYQALFALLGTQYGGDGVHTFALPKLTADVGKYIIAHQGVWPPRP